MAIKLVSKVNTDPAGTYGGKVYSKGKIKDDPLGIAGTPVDVNTYGDFHQFFATLLGAAGAIDVVGARITANGLPENDTDGQQYFASLMAVIADGAKTGAGGAGAWLDDGVPTFFAVGGGTFTGGSWTYNKYKQIGSTFYWTIQFRGGTIGGTVGEIDIQAPASFYSGGGSWMNLGGRFRFDVAYGTGLATPSNTGICILDNDGGGAPIIRLGQSGSNFGTGGNFNFDVNIVAEIS